MLVPGPRWGFIYFVVFFGANFTKSANCNKPAQFDGQLPVYAGRRLAVHIRMRKDVQKSRLRVSLRAWTSNSPALTEMFVSPPCVFDVDLELTYRECFG